MGERPVKDDPESGVGKVLGHDVFPHSAGFRNNLPALVGKEVHREFTHRTTGRFNRREHAHCAIQGRLFQPRRRCISPELVLFAG
jgi:hypothetical protein